MCQRIAIVCSVCLITLQAIAYEHPSVAELLDKYAETQDKLQSFIIKAEASTLINGLVHGGKLRANNKKDFGSYELRYDGERIFSAHKRWGDGDTVTGPIPKDAPTYSSALWDGRTYSRYGMDPRRTSDHDRLYIRRKDKAITAAKSVIPIGYDGHEMLGIFYGDFERVDSVLRQADAISIRSKMEKAGLAGTECYVIDAQVRGGTYTIWIDPKHGYNIAKAIVQKGTEAVPYGISHLRIKSAYNALEKVRFEKVDGIWVPMEADITMNRKWPFADEFADIKRHYKQTKVILNPDHEVLGSFIRNDVRNGTRVIIKDVGGITYTWQNGQVVDKQGRVIADFRKNAGKAHKENNSDAKR